MLKTLRGFKDFVLRGNVIDLSVGIVIGAAFTALVSSFTDSWIKPLLQLFGAGTDADGRATVGGKFRVGAVEFPYSTFISGIITFLITAAVLYFLVVTPLNRLNERRKKGVEPAPEPTPVPSEEVLLLREIRDALKAGGTVPGSRTPADSK